MSDPKTTVPTPAILALTKRWAIPSVLLLYALALVANVAFGTSEEWLPVFLAGTVLGPASFLIFRLILRLQRVNKGRTSRRAFTAGVWFLFGFGALSGLLLMLLLVVGGKAGLGNAFAMSLPIGMCFGAATSWEDAAYFEDR